MNHHIPLGIPITSLPFRKDLLRHCDSKPFFRVELDSTSKKKGKGMKFKILVENAEQVTPKQAPPWCVRPEQFEVIPW